MNENDPLPMKTIIMAVMAAIEPGYEPTGELWLTLLSTMSTIQEPLRRARLDLLWMAFNGHPETQEWSNLSIRQVLCVICAVMHLGVPPFSLAITYLQRLGSESLNSLPDEWLSALSASSPRVPNQNRSLGSPTGTISGPQMISTLITRSVGHNRTSYIDISWGHRTSPGCVKPALRELFPSNGVPF